MAGEKIEFKKGQTLKIKSVRSGTRQDGTEWMQINVVDESGKIEAGAFINPIAGLHEDDHVVIDDLSLISKRAPNRYAYNVKQKPFQKLDSPMMFITENTPNLTVHLTDGPGFGDGGSFETGGFDTAGFDANEGELPF